MLSRQQIRDRKRHLEKEEKQKRNRQLTLQELNDAERLLEQKRAARDQMALQTGSLCVAMLAQIPEKRDGVEKMSHLATLFLEALVLKQHEQLLTAADEPEEEEEPEDDDDEEEPQLAEAS